MVFIEGATFTMGAADPEKDPKEKELAEFERVEVHVEERPAHTVKVEAFCIDRTEVTAAAYNACVDHDGCARTSNDATTMECTASKADRQNHPINCIMWTQANDYCTRHGFVLPTEQQWEYAARGKDKRWYPWGGSRLLGDRDQDWCHAGTTCPVGSYPKARSPLGLDDMAGNVAEWTSSPFCTYPKEQCPEMDREKTYRASGFKMEPDHERVTGRRHAAPDFSRDDIGFRCAARPKP
jgi:formylglycine-generating enzyme required for sulfatase activity